MNKNILKRILAVTASVSVIASSLFVMASETSKIDIVIDNDMVCSVPDDMGRVFTKDDRTFVPVRFVTEFLGCSVNYLPPDTQNNDQIGASVTITNPATKTSYLLTIGDNKLFVLSDVSAYCINMDTKAFVADDERTYIPIRFLAEAMDYTVSWDETTQTVHMTSTHDIKLELNR